MSCDVSKGRLVKFRFFLYICTNFAQLRILQLITTMKERRLNDSAAMRWGALAVVSFTMMAAYFVNDVMMPLKSMLESELSWSSTEFGTYAGAYSFLNVFLLMLL